jgi:hypothetical protein
MEWQIGSHLEETELEQYLMGGLRDTRLDVFEGHFLACYICQDRLLALEAYVDAMRNASRRAHRVDCAVGSE